MYHQSLVDLLSVAALTRLQPAKQRYLFLLSHMRSYSSLLSHVLGTCPEIDGYGETHIKYRNKLDLWRLRQRVHHSMGTELHAPWLLDKILHNYVRPPDRLVPQDCVRALIFLRRPEEALCSVVTMARTSATHNSIGAMSSSQRACDYYVSRLHRLRTDGERIGQRAMYFDAEALIRQPQKLLRVLSQWLELSCPLRTEYQVLPRSGEVGFGDPSRNILAGRILDATSSTIADDVRIPDQVLREAEAAYRRCRASLTRTCHTTSEGMWH